MTVRRPATSSASPLGDAQLAVVAERMSAAGVSLRGPLTAQLIAGGRSNLTYRLSDGAARWVLRMPPLAGRTPSAHDVAREFRVTAALDRTEVPVAKAVLLAEDEAAIGAPFTVSEFVPGSTIRTRAELDGLDDVGLRAVAHGLVETLAALHRVDYVAVGLAGFGRPDGYAQRQLRRWSGQWELVGTQRLDRPARELARRLAAAVPEQESASIVHGDYRIDNTILSPETGPDLRVAAVVDWELSTIGDPVADVAMMCAYRHPAFDLIVGSPSAWTSTRLPDPPALAAAYEAAGDVRLVGWDAHLSLAYFKIAVIAAGIAHRARAGAASGPGFDTAGESVGIYLDLGLDTLGAHR